MQAVSRFTFAILIAIITSLGAFALVGCTDDTQQSQSSAAQTESASSEAADSQSTDDDEEQDNCYGDDLPAKKS